MEGTGTVGLVVVGLGGVGSSLLTGVLAARAHLVHPFGSLAEGGGSGRAPGLGPSPLRAAAPLAELGDLALGAFEVREDDAYRAALRANLVSRSLVDELRPELRKIHAMLGGRQAPTRRHLANALAEDLRGFLAHHRCARGVVVCTIPGVRAAPAKQVFTAGEVREALEQNADWITPGVVYAAAAAEAGCAFVAAGPDRALCAPGISALFAEKSLPVAGAGLVGPDALLRETLGQVLAMEGMQLAGAASLSTRAEERLPLGRTRSHLRDGARHGVGGRRLRAIARAARSRRALSRCAGPRRGIAGRAGRARAEERGAGVDGRALPFAARVRIAARGADGVAGRPARASAGRAAGARAQCRPGGGVAAQRRVFPRGGTAVPNRDRRVPRRRDRRHNHGFPGFARTARRRAAGVQACCLLHVRVSAAGRQTRVRVGAGRRGGGGPRRGGRGAARRAARGAPAAAS